MTAPSSQETEIREFFEKSIPDQIHLTAIIPDGPTSARDFGTDSTSAIKWALDQNGDGKNVYFSVNRIRPGINKKPAKFDVVAVRFAHVDIDPPKDNSSWEPQHAYESLVNSPAPPAFINWSGNGWQALWRVEDGVKPGEIEEVNSGIIAEFGGDKATHDVSRLLRVPGTVNWPSKKKMNIGRTPQLAKIAHKDDGSISSLLELKTAFPDLAKTSPHKRDNEQPINLCNIEFYTVDELALPQDDTLRALINKPEGQDRSKDTYALACEALRRGLTVQKIGGILLDPRNPISAHCLDQQDPTRAAIRAIEAAMKQADVARRLQQRQEDQFIAAGGDDNERFPTSHLWILEEMVERLVFVSDGSLVADCRNPRGALALNDFRNLTAGSETLRSVDGKNGSKRIAKVPTLGLWLKDPMRKHVEVVTFKPGAGQFTDSPEGRKALNTWTGLHFDAPPEDWQGQVELFESHVRWLWGADTDALLDWLAHLAQRPGELPTFGWLHIAKSHGMGRNWISGVLGRVFHGVTALGFDLSGALNTGFNGNLSSKVLVVVDEINEGASGRSYQHAQTLKRLITEETRTINPKYGRQRIEYNASRWLIFSNSSTALPLEDDDRRFWVVNCNDQPRTEAYYSNLYARKSDPAFIASVAHWLVTRDISGFNPGRRPPMSEAKLSLLSRTRSESEQTLFDISAYWPVDIITSPEIHVLLGDERPTNAALRHAYDRAGLMRVKKWNESSPLGKKKVSAYSVRNAELWKNASVEALKKEVTRASDEAKNTALNSDAQD